MQCIVHRVPAQRRERVLFFIVGIAEKSVEMTIDRVTMPAEREGKGAPVGETARPGQRGSRFGIRRQFMRLGVVAILQPVLDVAQEHVSVAKLGHRGRRQQSARERRQRWKCSARAQRGLRPRVPVARPGR